jgi:hypothetical protein
VDQAAALRRDHRGHGGPPAPVGCETAALTKAEGARRGGGRGGGLEGGAGSRAEQACVGWGGGQQRDMGAETDHLARVSCWRVTVTFLGESRRVGKIADATFQKAGGTASRIWVAECFELEQIESKLSGSLIITRI